MPDSKGKKLADALFGQSDFRRSEIEAQRQAELDKASRAAFGVSTQRKRRTQQDPEAAKDIPLQLLRGWAAGTLGLPGDIEGLIRMLPGLDETPRLPTSEFYLDWLPGKTDKPSGSAAAGLGTLFGGLGSTKIARGALEAGKGAQRLAERAAAMPSPSGLAAQRGVVKLPGGNWLTGSVEKGVAPLKANRPNADEELRKARELFTPEYKSGMSPEAVARLENETLPRLEKEVALNKWIDSNLTNYIKKQMATPDDPVRKLAEEGISHRPLTPYSYETAAKAAKKREVAGGGRYGKSQLAKQWEDESDVAINAPRASAMAYPSVLEQNPWLTKLDPNERVYAINTPASRAPEISELGFDHIVDVLRQDLASGRIRPEQLNKVSMEQAVRRTYEYDQEMAKKMAEAKIKATEGMPVYKEYPEGYKWVELTRPEPKMEGLKSEYLPEVDMWRIVDENGGVVSSGATEKEAIGLLKREEREKALEDALTYEGETMGHCVGGYCPDVLEGRSRIYSLRDAKGEPHVTVEVQPNNADRNSAYIDFLRDDRRNQGGAFTAWLQKKVDADPSFQKKEALDVANMFRAENGLPPIEVTVPPPKIVQIKGKQNLAPKEDYLPYVQDFVRSGQWSQVGDLKNTGLRRVEAPEGVKYLTEDEYGDHILRELGVDPAEGMKRGGKVSFSDNPDTMKLELAGGGAVKALRALVKGAKEEEKAAMKASEALGEMEGRPLLITQTDRSKVGGKWLGGPGFSGLQHARPEYKAAEAAWGVAQMPTAKTILGGYQKAKKEFGAEPVMTTMIGTPTQHQSNKMVFEELHRLFKKSAKEGNLDPDLLVKINDRLRMAVDKEGKPIFPEDVNILAPDFRKVADTFDRRAVASNLMGGMGVGGKKGQIIDYDEVIRHTTDPALLEAPSGALGNRMFTLSGGIVERPDLHPAFPTILQGEDLGKTFAPVPREEVMRDFIERTMREKGRTPGYMDYTRGHPPVQLITEELLTDLQKKGYAEGGAVSGISGDDLIIEERPL